MHDVRVLLLLLLLLLSIVLSHFIHVHGMIVVYYDYALSSVDVATALAFFGTMGDFFWVHAGKDCTASFHSRGVCFTIIIPKYVRLDLRNELSGTLSKYDRQVIVLVKKGLRQNCQPNLDHIDNYLIFIFCSHTVLSNKTQQRRMTDKSFLSNLNRCGERGEDVNTAQLSSQVPDW